MAVPPEMRLDQSAERRLIGPRRTGPLVRTVIRHIDETVPGQARAIIDDGKIVLAHGRTVGRSPDCRNAPPLTTTL